MPLFGRRGDSGERSRAEREAARLERERRRAAREGRPLPEPAPEPAPVSEPEPEPEPEPIAEEHPPPAAEPASEQTWEHHEALVEEPATEHAGWDHEPAPQPVAEDAPVAPEPPAWEQNGGRGPSTEPLHLQQGPVTEPFSPVTPLPEERPTERPTMAWTAEDEEAATAPPTSVGAVAAGTGHPGRRTVSLPRAQSDLPEDDHFHDAPIGTRRGGRAPSYVPQPGAGAPGHRTLTVRRRRGRRRLVIFTVLLLVLLGALAFAVYKVFQPFHGPGTGAVRVTIPSGATASDIGDRLQKAGVVESGSIFSLRARLAGKRGELRAGTFTLKRDMPYGAALTVLTTPPRSAPVINVTLPEGPSRSELAPIVRNAGVQGSYLKASVSSKLLDPRTYGAPKGTRSLEGFLFPSTYELRRSTATARGLVDAQLKAFRQNIAKVSFARARTKNLSRYDVLTIASMIEREARVPRERPLVAAVIYNRLEQGIPLGIDATIRFATHNWSSPLHRSELARNTPYNTRKNKGLPPGPIGNPGLASIQAAANPATVPYLFYVVRPCGNGAHNFSSTDAQFQRDVAAYNRKRDQLHGKDPSTCKK